MHPSSAPPINTWAITITILKALWPLFAILLCVSLIRMVVTGARAARMSSPAGLPYRLRSSLLTPTELSFFHVLRDALPEYTICPMVRVADIVNPTTTRYADLNRITAKHADFVVCDSKSLSPLAVVELDDTSHEREDRQKRDAFVDAVYGKVGLTVVHIRPARAYEASDIRLRVLGPRAQPSHTNVT